MRAMRYVSALSLALLFPLLAGCPKPSNAPGAVNQTTVVSKNGREELKVGFLPVTCRCWRAAPSRRMRRAR